MGIDAAGAEFLAFAARCGADFVRTVTLGRQTLSEPIGAIAEGLAKGGSTADLNELPRPDVPRSRAADGVLRALGAQSITALDYSGFEGAELIHDLNDAIPHSLFERASVVFDGGTSEHVLHPATALENGMRMVEVGGHLISIMPMNQQVGHGLYQVSPELFLRLLTEQNGFAILAIVGREYGVRNRWFQVADPAERGHRLSVATLGPAELMVLARKASPTPDQIVAYQSDYEQAWLTDGVVRVSPQRSNRDALRSAIIRRSPPRLLHLGASLRQIGASVSGRQPRTLKRLEPGHPARSPRCR